jgi:hypothetical protein
MPEKSPEPLELSLSPKVRARIHDDGSVDVILRAPWPLPDIPYRIDPDEVDEALHVFEIARRRREAYRRANPSPKGTP